MDMELGSMIGGVGSLIGALAGAGPWGIAAMVLGVLGLGGFATFLIKKWNAKVDAEDMQRSGAATGKAAADLKNQTDSARKWRQKGKDEYFSEEGE